jgi:stress-induced morphogen
MANSESNPSPQDVAHWIAQGLDCEHLQVDGDGRHFQAVIVASAFEGLRSVQRHQRVYAALGDLMRETVHALSMRTLTPAEWAATNNTPAGDASTTEARRRSGV